jgi:hypothetical protein
MLKVFVLNVDMMNVVGPVFKLLSMAKYFFGQSIKKMNMCKSKTFLADWATNVKPGNPYRRGWLSTFDLLLITRLDQLLLMLQTLLYILQNNLPL